MAKVQYIINPPKLGDDGSVYYKDIVVYSVQDDNILGAVSYDYNFNGLPISILDIQYDPAINVYFKRINHDIHEDSLTVSKMREYWIFDTEYEAFIQKVICLQKIRDIFYTRQKESKANFNATISTSTLKYAIDTLKKRNPEYFL